ncbi:MAG: MBL fold metallo-hydrolase [Calditrichia bacterium]
MMLESSTNTGIHYISIGAVDQIGASAHYLRLGDWGILLDAGLDPASLDESALPDFELIKDQPVNAIIVSHAHLDHLGALPVAIRYFPHARIYMTPATAALSEALLFHYLKVREKRGREERVELPYLYNAQDVENLLFLFQSFRYNFPFKIHGFHESDIHITFWDAGHILGSAGVEIEWRGRTLFYTGNTKKSAQFILKGADYPPTADILITETTYGSDEQAPLQKKPQEVNRFAHFLREKIRLGGAVLIPVFALGRTQEIMVLLHRMIRKGKIPPIPIYLTGFGIRINKIYDRLVHKIYPEYDTQTLDAISFDTLRGKRFHKPCVILATSGMMMPNTISYEIAADFLLERGNAIAFVGWADPETPGGSLRGKKLQKIKEIFGVKQILCDVEVFRFSAHSHREELLLLVKRLAPQKTVLCHGEPEALKWMEHQIVKRKLSPQVWIPQKGEETIL